MPKLPFLCSPALPSTSQLRGGIRKAVVFFFLMSPYPQTCVPEGKQNTWVWTVHAVGPIWQRTTYALLHGLSFGPIWSSPNDHSLLPLFGKAYCALPTMITPWHPKRGSDWWGGNLGPLELSKLVILPMTWLGTPFTYIHYNLPEYLIL